MAPDRQVQVPHGVLLFSLQSLHLLNSFYLFLTAPDQQPPPSYEAINSTAVKLIWKGPDYPNGLITQYMLFRNGTLVYTLKGNGKPLDIYYEISMMFALFESSQILAHSERKVQIKKLNSVKINYGLKATFFMF